MKTKKYRNKLMDLGYIMLVEAIILGLIILIKGFILVDFLQVLFSINFIIFGIALSITMIYASCVPNLEILNKYTSNAASTNGKQLNKVNERLDYIKKENMELKNKLNELKDKLNELENKLNS